MNISVTALFVVFCLGLLVPSGLMGCEVTEESGACVIEATDDGAWWCDEDEEQQYCNAQWDADLGLGNVSTFHAGRICPDVGYAYWCDYDDMVASGAPLAYYIARYLSNEGCDPTVPASGGTGSYSTTCDDGYHCVEYYSSVASEIVGIDSQCNYAQPASCPSGPVCTHVNGTLSAITYTYNASAEEVRTLCLQTEGTYSD